MAAAIPGLGDAALCQCLSWASYLRGSLADFVHLFAINYRSQYIGSDYTLRHVNDSPAKLVG